ncbi:aryl sulfotransferase [Caulobacter ginsengisoli]|uniref:Aryl sulfotransferase n=1 Tax=Caulobacter ginsengisoli TaxID=400775 RepID=A0ABU0IU60_9CAUL|nr:sulfotransferase domain-containing protein [Caulobacter ginsengisoli]MDQ0465547.1 aryl sulfotransferase [Caulobacter ginsengisoli]
MLSRAPEKPVRDWYCDSAHWDQFTPRDGDVIIATAPKVGTTWTQQIVKLLVFQSPEPGPLGMVSPWLDCRFQMPLPVALQVLEAQPHRRFVKSHLPMSALPIWEDVKYIHVARDGRDACMSFFNHVSAYTPFALSMLDGIGEADPLLPGPWPRPPRTVREFFHHWIEPGGTRQAELMADGFFEIERSFWAERGRANVLLLHYADMKADLDGEMRRVAAFLDIPVNEALWPDLVAAADFSAMQRDGATLMMGSDVAFEGGHKTFLNKGTNGRWQGELTAEDLALYHQRVAAELSPGLAHWLEHGRLVAGDPAVAGD